MGKSHSGEKWECVGDQSGATQMYLTTLTEDSIGTVYSQALWAWMYQTSLVCPIRSLLNHLCPFPDLGGWGSHKQAFPPVLFLAYDLPQPIRILEEG